MFQMSKHRGISAEKCNLIYIYIYIYIYIERERERETERERGGGNNYDVRYYVRAIYSKYLVEIATFLAAIANTNAADTYRLCSTKLMLLTHCDLVVPHGAMDLGPIDSGNGLVPDGTKSMPEPLLLIISKAPWHSQYEDQKIPISKMAE